MSDQEEPGPSGYSRTSARVTAPSNPNSDTNLIICALVFKRAAVKRKITGNFKKLDSDSTLANKQAGIAVVNSLLDQIFSLDINDAYFQACNGEFDLSETYERELDGQTDYDVDVRAKLTDLSPNSTNKPLVEQTGNASNCKLKLPDLKWDSFSGEGVNNLQFHAFQTKFDNIIGNRSDISNSTKFTYLASYLNRLPDAIDFANVRAAATSGVLEDEVSSYKACSHFIEGETRVLFPVGNTRHDVRSAERVCVE